MMRDPDHQAGFTLIEMIVVIVITGIIAGAVALFIRTPVQGYIDSARRAEMTDVADTALRRIGRDLRTAVPNSVRLPVAAGSTYIEFLPTRDGGRYRRAQTAPAGNLCGVATADNAGDALAFHAPSEWATATPDTCFEIIGPRLTFAAGDQIVIGSTQADGNPPYQDPTGPACLNPAISTCIRRAVTPGTNLPTVTMLPAVQFPPFAELFGQRFDIIPGDQQAVTYACVGIFGVDANGNGQARLMRYWKYGFNAALGADTTALGGQAAILANNVRNCNIVYTFANQRSGLVEITLVITQSGESISLYHQIHVNNIP